jgi:hypothetical protein
VHIVRRAALIVASGHAVSHPMLAFGRRLGRGSAALMLGACSCARQAILNHAVISWRTRNSVLSPPGSARNS